MAQIEHGFSFRRGAGLLGKANPEASKNDSSHQRALASPANCTARQRNDKGRIGVPQLVQRLLARTLVARRAPTGESRSMVRKNI
jgi:hypothetical protein